MRSRDRGDKVSSALVKWQCVSRDDRRSGSTTTALHGCSPLLEVKRKNIKRDYCSRDMALPPLSEPSTPRHTVWGTNILVSVKALHGCLIEIVGPLIAFLSRSFAVLYKSLVRTLQGLLCGSLTTTTLSRGNLNFGRYRIGFSVDL